MGLLSWCPIITSLRPTIISSDNDLSPGRLQAIIWTNAGILLIGPLWTNFSEILFEIYTFSFWKMTAILSRLQCIKSSHCDSCDDLAPVDAICRCLIFRWVAGIWLLSRYQFSGHKDDMPYWVSCVSICQILFQFWPRMLFLNFIQYLIHTKHTEAWWHVYNSGLCQHWFR